jgi:hypothetical protein
MPAVPLASLLLRASRWFDRQLLEGLQAAGWPALTAAQSLVLAHLDRTGTPPAELARRLGHSRQATHQPGHTQPARPSTEPARRGGRLVTLTDSGHAMTGDARRLLLHLEDELGRGRAAELRNLLNDFDRSDSRPSRADGVRHDSPESTAARTTHYWNGPSGRMPHQGSSLSPESCAVPSSRSSAVTLCPAWTSVR